MIDVCMHHKSDELSHCGNLNSIFLTARLYANTLNSPSSAPSFSFFDSNFLSNVNINYSRPDRLIQSIWLTVNGKSVSLKCTQILWYQRIKWVSFVSWNFPKKSSFLSFPWTNKCLYFEETKKKKQNNNCIGIQKISFPYTSALCCSSNIETCSKWILRKSVSFNATKIREKIR